MRNSKLVKVLLVAVAGAGATASRAQAQPPEVKPGPQHKMLAKDVGTWDASIKSWMAGPGSEPMVSKGVETDTLMGGLWLISEFKGDFGGQSFEGRGVTGYDPKKSKYVGTWFDSMSTEIMIMEGDVDEKAGTLTMTSKGKDASGKDYEAKTVTERKGDDTRVFTMYMKAAETKDELMKVMEITYTRRAK